jgi:hypothetical protein
MMIKRERVYNYINTLLNGEICSRNQLPTPFPAGRGMGAVRLACASCKLAAARECERAYGHGPAARECERAYGHGTAAA